MLSSLRQCRLSAAVLVLVAPGALSSCTPDRAPSSEAKSPEPSAAGGGPGDASPPLANGDAASGKADGAAGAPAVADSGTDGAAPSGSLWCSDSSKNAFFDVHLHAGRMSPGGSATSGPGDETLDDFRTRMDALKSLLENHSASANAFVRPAAAMWWQDSYFDDHRHRITVTGAVRPHVVNDGSGAESELYGNAGGGDPLDLIDLYASLGVRAIKIQLKFAADNDFAVNPHNGLVANCWEGWNRTLAAPPFPQPTSHVGSLGISSRDYACLGYDDDTIALGPATASATTLTATVADYFRRAADLGLNVIVHGDEQPGSALGQRYMGSLGLRRLLDEIRTTRPAFSIHMGHGPQLGGSLDSDSFSHFGDGLSWETSGSLTNRLADDWQACGSDASCEQRVVDAYAERLNGAERDPAMVESYVFGSDVADPVSPGAGRLAADHALERRYLIGSTGWVDERELFCERTARFLRVD